MRDPLLRCIGGSLQSLPSEIKRLVARQSGPIRSIPIKAPVWPFAFLAFSFFPSSLCWSPWYVGGALSIVGTLHLFVCHSCVVPAFSFFFLPFVGVPGVFGTGGASANAPTSLFVLSSFLLLSPRLYFPFVPLFESLGCHGLSWTPSSTASHH